MQKVDSKYYTQSGVKHYLRDDRELLTKTADGYKIVKAADYKSYDNLYLIDTNKLDWIVIRE